LSVEDNDIIKANPVWEAICDEEWIKEAEAEKEKI
jgi:hypothetical protein